MARTAPGLQTWSRVSKRGTLTSTSSTTASTTRSASARSVIVRGAGDPVRGCRRARPRRACLAGSPCRGTSRRGAHGGDLVGAASDVGDVVAAAGEHLDDPGRHRAGADDADLRHRATHLRLRIGGRGQLVVDHDRTSDPLVGVETPAGLASEHAGGDELLEDGGRRVEPVPALLVHRVEDLVRRVEPDQVEERERTHRVAAAEPHRGIDVLTTGVVTLVQGHRVVEVAEQKRVGDEARLVAGHDRDLAEGLRERGRLLDDPRLGDDRPDDLDELLDRCRVEEVHADDTPGQTRRGADLGHRQGRGVGGQDGVLGDHAVEPLEELALERELLDDRLDDQLALLDVGQVGGEGHPAEQLGLFVLRHLAAPYRTAGRLLDMLPAHGQGVVIDLDPDHPVAVAGEDFGDAGAHRAEPDDADRGELACHGMHPPTPVIGSAVTHLTRAPGASPRSGQRGSGRVDCPAERRRDGRGVSGR